MRRTPCGWRWRLRPWTRSTPVCAPWLRCSRPERTISIRPNEAGAGARSPVLIEERQRGADHLAGACVEREIAVDRAIVALGHHVEFPDRGRTTAHLTSLLLDY